METSQPLLNDVELAGSKVLLRPIAIADVDAAWPLLHGRREVTDQLMWDGPESREELVRRYESWIDARPSGAGYHLAVVERASGTYCGSMGLRFIERPFEGGLGYWLGQRHWSAGLGTEAIGLVAHLAFTHLSAQRLFATVFVGNVASERVLAKNGFHEDPARSDRVEKSGELRTRRYFYLTAADWRARAGKEPPQHERVVLREV